MNMESFIGIYLYIFEDLFSGSSYASAYYVYLWAEVLDAGTVPLLL
jgi:Zn-dependent oligopeptidase